jgi:hypothetical protein
MDSKSFQATVISTPKAAYWMGYRAGSNYAATGNERLLPAQGSVSWEVARKNGVESYFQMGVHDGIVQKHGEVTEVMADVNEWPEIPMSE